VPGSGGSGGGTGLGCGNGKRDENELCEGNDLGGQTCETALGLPGATGSLACNGNCTFNTSACQLPSGGGAGAGGATGGAGGVAQSGCGDGQKEGAEQCDGTDFGAASCVTALGNPLAIGALACHANCTIDAAACSAPGGSGASTGSGCGDGVKAGAEQCDGADFGGATCATALGAPGSTGVLSCYANCTINASACALRSPSTRTAGRCRSGRSAPPCGAAG
jgi:hypothetical protein